jgi:hypothetical protein
MRSSRRHYAAVAAAVLLAGVPGIVLAQPAGGEKGPPPPAHVDIRPGYAKLAQLPDWSGVWAPDWAALFGAGAPPKPELTAKAAKALADFEAAQAKGENLQGEVANCVPPGMPGIMRQPYPIEFVFAPGTVYILAETYSQVRRIYTDGRPLPDDPDPFFNGHSVGHWEGDTLVVDTNGLNPHLDIMPGIKATEKTTIRERIHQNSPNLITIEFTVTDPDTFAKPFTFRQPYVLKPGWEIREYVCQENNRDHADEFGRPSMSIDF